MSKLASKVVKTLLDGLPTARDMAKAAIVAQGPRFWKGAEFDRDNPKNFHWTVPLARKFIAVFHIQQVDEGSLNLFVTVESPHVLTKKFWPNKYIGVHDFVPIHAETWSLLHELMVNSKKIRVDTAAQAEEIFSGMTREFVHRVHYDPVVAEAKQPCPLSPEEFMHGFGRSHFSAKYVEDRLFCSFDRYWEGQYVSWLPLDKTDSLYLVVKYVPITFDSGMFSANVYNKKVESRKNPVAGVAHVTIDRSNVAQLRFTKEIFDEIKKYAASMVGWDFEDLESVRELVKHVGGLVASIKGSASPNPVGESQDELPSMDDIILRGVAGADPSVWGADSEMSAWGYPEYKWTIPTGEPDQVLHVLVSLPKHPRSRHQTTRQAGLFVNVYYWTPACKSHHRNVVRDTEWVIVRKGDETLFNQVLFSMKHEMETLLAGLRGKVGADLAWGIRQGIDKITDKYQAIFNAKKSPFESLAKGVVSGLLENEGEPDIDFDKFIQGVAPVITNKWYAVPRKTDVKGVQCWTIYRGKHSITIGNSRNGDSRRLSYLLDLANWLDQHGHRWHPASSFNSWINNALSGGLGADFLRERGRTGYEQWPNYDPPVK